MTQSVQASRIRTKAELCLLETVPEPCAIVIFGASGDLAFRKLIPALFHLEQNNLLPERYFLVGVARTEFSDAMFRRKVGKAIGGSSQARAQGFIDRWSYLGGDYADPETYGRLKALLSGLDKRHGVHERRIFFFSTPPPVYPDIIERLGSSGLAASTPHGKGWVRVVMEKPFGRDLVSARRLNAEVHRTFREDQVYRIDHYLGKETVQNIMMFRFANSLFEPAWNRNCIDHVQITASETLGVGTRAGYYEKAGVLRDMVQNHLLQLLALIAMEPPTRLNAAAVRDRKSDVFNAIRPVGRGENAVLAQYACGRIAGRKVMGYRQETGVRADSETPTFAALRLEIDNWRWQGVPFYLRSGKRMGARVTEIAVFFKRVPVSIFKPLLADELSPNVLRFRIQPEEGVSVSFEAKHPGPKLCMSTVTMDFDYRKTFKTPPPEAYARLLLDAMTGDQTLFGRSDGVEQCWGVLEPLLGQGKSRRTSPLVLYPAGGWGPAKSDGLLSREGRAWDLPYDATPSGVLDPAVADPYGT